MILFKKKMFFYKFSKNGLKLKLYCIKINFIKKVL